MLATESHLLQGLNENQKAAVLETEGRILVLAGAGSGKTKVLTTKVVYLLEQGVDPWRILAITFTNKAAKEMKERLHAMNPYAFKTWVGTFHNICLRILMPNIQYLGIEKFTPIDESDQRSIVKTAAASLGIEVDKAAIRSMISQISLWKSEMITPGQAQSMTQGHKDKADMANVFQMYEDIKAVHAYYDFDDLLLKTIELFKAAPELLGKYQNLFRYILVDEYQDTNKVQFELIEMLGQKHGNIFLVGDGDQSIYSFRSAKIENILRYQQIHPETKLFVLNKNYRSTQAIVNASNALVTNNKMRLDREALSVGGRGDDIHIFRFNDMSREADFIARLIVNIRKTEKKDWKDFAVLFRMNFQIKQLELALNDQRIPYKVIGSVSFYEKTEIKHMIAYLRACHNLTDDLAVKSIINVPKRGIGPTTVDKITLFAEDRKIPFFTALMNIDEVAGPAKIKKGTVSKIKEFVEVLRELSSESVAGEFSATTFIKNMLKKTEFQTQFDPNKEEDEARIENIGHLRDYAQQWDLQEKEQNSLAQFISEISLDGDRDDIDDEDFVTLTTVHSAKGLEWSQVFAIGLEDDTFPHFRSKQKAADLEEERRLMYVAMTRAAERLFITHSVYKFEWGSNKPVKQKPSPFLNEIPDEYKTVIVQT